MHAFGEVGFAPHVAGLAAERDQATTVLGQTISFPVLISPTGVQAVHPEGEVAVARAAAAAGTAIGPVSFATQLDRGRRGGQPADLLPDVLGRDAGAILAARRAGPRGRGARASSSRWTGRSPRAATGAARHPREARPQGDARFAPEGLAPAALPARLARSGALPDLTTPNLADRRRPAPTFFGAYGEWMTTPLPTWDDIAWMRETWGGPFMVKGICGPDDARRAVDAGVTRDLGVQPRRQQPRRHPGVDPGAPRRRRRGRRPGRGAARRRACAAALTSSRRSPSAPRP